MPLITFGLVMLGIGLYQLHKYWPDDKANALIPFILGVVGIIGGVLILILTKQ